MADARQATDVELARRIDRMCDRFEGNWRLGRRQNIETYLVSVAETERAACLKSLLELEVELRRTDGETPMLAEYLDRFPDQPAVLHAVFRAQRLVDSLVAKRSTLDSQAEQTGTGRRKKGAIRQFLPTQFGRYLVKHQIGAGGMGTVVLAEDTLLGRPVALKIPYLSGTDIDEQIKRFDREARTAAMLRHPNICPIYDFGEIDGIRYLSMAYIDGLPLHKYVAENPLDERQIARLIEKLAGALQDAHEHGVVHRDLKPANIMMDKKGEPIVTDFGLAMQMQLAADVRLTQTGMQMGSPAYMPPEQVDGDKDRIGPTADIYSLGVVLYELLTGRIPFEGSTAAIFTQIIIKEPIRPSLLRAGLSPVLESICLKMMSKRIEDRFASMADVSNTIADFVRRAAISSQAAEFDSQPDELFKTPTETEPRDAVDSTYPLNDAPSQATDDTSTPESPLDSRDWVSQAQSRTRAAAASSLRQVLKGKDPAFMGNGWTAQQPEESKDASLVSPEAEVRMLILDITNAMRDGAMMDDLITKVDRVLELQPDNPAMLRLQKKLRLLTPQVKSAEAARSPDNLPSERSAPQDHNLEELVAALGVKALPINVSKTKVKVLLMVLAPFLIWTLWRAFSRPETKTNELNKRGGYDRAIVKSTYAHSAPSAPAAPVAVQAKPIQANLIVRGQETLTFKGHTGVLRSVTFSPDGRQLVSADNDGIVKVWDAISGQETFTLRSQSNVAFSPDGRWLVLATNGRLKLWNAENGRETLMFKGYFGGGSVAFSPDGKLLAGIDQSSGFPCVKVWDATSGQETITFKEHTGRIRSVTFNPDGKRLASGGGWDQSVKVWDATSGQVMLTLKGHTHDIVNVVFSPKGNQLASASLDRTVRVWDAASGQVTLTLTDVRSVAFSPDGKRMASVSYGTPLAAGTYDGKVKVWDAISGLEAFTLSGFGSTTDFSSVTFSPDGKLLALSGSMNSVKVWDATNGQETVRFNGHTSLVSAVAFSPNGKRLASASYDRTVKVWDLTSPVDPTLKKE